MTSVMKIRIMEIYQAESDLTDLSKPANIPFNGGAVGEVFMRTKRSPFELLLNG